MSSGSSQVESLPSLAQKPLPLKINQPALPVLPLSLSM
jgi:hypothetical protein